MDIDGWINRWTDIYKDQTSTVTTFIFTVFIVIN